MIWEQTLLWGSVALLILIAIIVGYVFFTRDLPREDFMKEHHRRIRHRRCECGRSFMPPKG